MLQRSMPACSPRPTRQSGRLMRARSEVLPPRIRSCDDRPRIGVLVAMRTGIVARFRRVDAGMEIGSGFDPIFERIHPELYLKFLPYAIGLSNVTAGFGFRDARAIEEVLPDFEISELVVGREGQIRVD